MRLVLPILVTLFAVHCAPQQSASLATVAGAEKQANAGQHSPTHDAPKPLVIPEPPAHPASPPRASNTEISGIRFTGVSFDSRSHRLTVVDQAGGPSSQFGTAASAAQSRNALAACNGGFFTPEGKPLGLVVTDGNSAGYWNTASSLGTGVWLETKAGNPSIKRRGAIGASAVRASAQALQAGPMLVENGNAVGGLSDAKQAPRTVLLWDGTSRWWLGITSSCSLRKLGQALASSGPAGWPVRHALNLDGGRSSELWVSQKVSGGPINKRPPWNRPVRNFLLLQPR